MGTEVPATDEDLIPAAAERGRHPEDTGAAFARNTAVMSAGTALSRLTGFLRLSAMAYAIGVTESRLADAYNVANTTPNIVYELALGAVLSSVFVPVFVEWLQNRGREEAWEVARAVLTVAVVVLGAITLIGIFAAPWIIRLYMANYTPAERAAAEDLAVFFLQWFMPQILLYGVGAVATGLLNAHRRFAAPMFAPVLNNLVVIATFLTFAAMHDGPIEVRGITGPQKLVLAVGTTLGVLAMTAALWPSLRRVGFRFSWRGAWRHEAVRRIARLARWAFVYVLVNQLGYLVIIVLAGDVTGGYAAYSAAFILFQLPHAIFAVSIMTALLPAMSSRWSAEDRAGFRSYLARGIRASAFIVIPAALGYLVLARPIVRLLLENGVFTGQSTDLVAGVLFYFSLGLFSFSTFQLLLRAFYAMQDTRTPAVINIASVALNTVLNIVLFGVMGVRGLALGHAVAYTFASAVAIVVIRGRLGGLDGRRLLAGLGKVLVGAGLTAAAAWGTSVGLGRLLGTATVAAELAQVAGSVAVGLLVFLAAALVLRMEELELLKGILSRRFRR
ncbi:MAG: murein biosynthesis integral membrane protein MurJ [Actinobacteria bacterium]|nr:murein biosynthesis integral membrane protein MurJ [Actinomycetota bacterium]